MFPREAVGRLLQGRTQYEVNRLADQLLRLTRDFEQLSRRDRHGFVKRRQQVDVTAGSCLATCRRTEDF